MIYETLSAFGSAFGGDHPRIVKKLLHAWEAAQEGIKQITYDKRSQSVWVEAKSNAALNELHARKPNTRTRITFLFDDSKAKEEQLHTRRRKRGEDPVTGEYKGW
jgi:hypothetical protein